jgi:hypothetical protein
VRALYRALIQSEDRFQEFEAHLAIYDAKTGEADEELPHPAAVRCRLNQRIRSWLSVPFDGLSAEQMREWRAIVIEERFDIAPSPWQELDSIGIA